jgi:hypothetical protein
MRYSFDTNATQRSGWLAAAGWLNLLLKKHLLTVEVYFVGELLAQIRRC